VKRQTIICDVCGVEKSLQAFGGGGWFVVTVLGSGMSDTTKYLDICSSDCLSISGKNLLEASKAP